jgi:hypothetical protein
MYRIITSEVIDDGIRTTTEFTLSDGSVKTIEQTHYMPENKDAVLIGIQNQEAVEEKRINLSNIATELCG